MTEWKMTPNSRMRKAAICVRKAVISAKGRLLLFDGAHGFLLARDAIVAVRGAQRKRVGGGEAEVVALVGVVELVVAGVAVRCDGLAVAVAGGACSLVGDEAGDVELGVVAEAVLGFDVSLGTKVHEEGHERRGHCNGRNPGVEVPSWSKTDTSEWSDFAVRWVKQAATVSDARPEADCPLTE
ncbi:hypothetical protein MRB53_037554 [Persea americana]|nr:hypothetical protein MRB53_037554 [Persea americana]